LLKRKFGDILGYGLSILCGYFSILFLTTFWVGENSKIGIY